MSLKTCLLPIVLGLVLALALIIEAGPMYYKKVSGQKYEPDWVAVSSTVIPLAEYRVSVGANEQQKSAPVVPDDEYRRAYLKHLQQTSKSKSKLLNTQKQGSDATVAQARVQEEDPDTLITANKKFYEKKGE